MDWGVFTRQNIARMLEVEFTSELMLLMLNGVSAGSKPAIDNFYEEHDEEFKARKVVEQRFRRTMDAIDDLLGEDLADMAFNRKLLFYGLFALMYDGLFGLGSPLKRGTKGSGTGRLKEAVIGVDQRVKAEQLPPEVAENLSRRTTHLGTRQAFVDFLREEWKRA